MKNSSTLAGSSRLLGLGAVAMSAAMLAACGSPAATNTSSPEPGGTTSATAPAGTCPASGSVVNLTYWSWGDG